ncbi:MAG: hypothetical protein H6821_02740 [Planctomycetaceae bacterium]|nr:hypothetical protein [Planctomycetaceae bacterium]
MLNLSVLHNKKLFLYRAARHGLCGRECEAHEGRQFVFASAEREAKHFRKHGIVELFLERLNHLPVERIPHEPHLFKIASYGSFPRSRDSCKGCLQNTRRWSACSKAGEPA